MCSRRPRRNSNNMSTKFAAFISVRTLAVHWEPDVRFKPRITVRRHTETRLRAAPVTLDVAQAMLNAEFATAEDTGCTATGNTEFRLRELPPPAEAA